MPRHIGITIKYTVDYHKVIEGWDEEQKQRLLEGDPEAREMFEASALFLAYKNDILTKDEEVG
jgi:hypothetical protein